MLGHKLISHPSHVKCLQFELHSFGKKNQIVNKLDWYCSCDMIYDIRESDKLYIVALIFIEKHL